MCNGEQLQQNIKDSIRDSHTAFQSRTIIKKVTSAEIAVLNLVKKGFQSNSFAFPKN